MSKQDVLDFLISEQEKKVKAKRFPIHTLDVDIKIHFEIFPRAELKELIKERKIKWGHTLNNIFFQVIE